MKCENCGFEVEETDVLCSNCGEPLNNEVENNEEYVEEEVTEVEEDVTVEVEEDEEKPDVYDAEGEIDFEKLKKHIADEIEIEEEEKKNNKKIEVSNLVSYQDVKMPDYSLEYDDTKKELKEFYFNQMRDLDKKILELKSEIYEIDDSAFANKDKQYLETLPEDVGNQSIFAMSNDIAEEMKAIDKEMVRLSKRKKELELLNTQLLRVYYDWVGTCRIKD